jgi:hypothetical protein
MKRHASKRLAAARQDRHDGPIALPEHSREGFLVLGAGVRAVAWVGVDPDPGYVVFHIRRIMWCRTLCGVLGN